jgi:hypothetical protein
MQYNKNNAFSLYLDFGFWIFYFCIWIFYFCFGFFISVFGFFISVFGFFISVFDFFISVLDFYFCFGFLYNINRYSGLCSGKMGGHVALQVEVGELLTLLQLEEGLELGIGVDAATVLLVLQVVVANIGVDLAGHFGSSHLGTIGLSQKLGQLLGNEGGLHKARRGAVSDLATLLGTGLLRGANLLDGMALKDAKLGSESASKSNHLLQLGRNGSKLGCNDRIGGRNRSNVGGSVGGNNRWNRGSGLGLLGLLGLLGSLGGLGSLCKIGRASCRERVSPEV